MLPMEKEQDAASAKLETHADASTVVARAQCCWDAVTSTACHVRKTRTTPSFLVRYLRLKRNPAMAAAAMLTILVIVCCLLTVLECLFSDRVPTVVWVCFMMYNYAQGHGSKLGWFMSGLPSAAEVARWSDAQLDAQLHGLSRWDNFSHSDFEDFNMAFIRPLNLGRNETFYFLEVGMGVGAFSREILQAFPHASGAGFDLVPRAIEIARVVLPATRMRVYTGDMLRVPEPSASFDLVFVPGALCYLASMRLVRQAVAEFTRVLVPHGRLCINLLASDTSPTGSCVVRVPKSFWQQEAAACPFALALFSTEDMASWHLEHALGRYSVCLRKQVLQ